jgi:hypothetical protein
MTGRHLSRRQFNVPPEFGTTPIPEGMVRFNHYTDPGAVEGIQKHGLLRSKGEESFARGGTESPQVFMTAGHPKDLLHSSTVVEGWADPATQLDVGENWRRSDPVEHAQYMESRRSTITARGDIPASQIVAVHEPWHQSYRYLMDDPEHRKEVFQGGYDNLHDVQDYGPALDAAKVHMIGAMLLGGKNY